MASSASVTEVAASETPVTCPSVICTLPPIDFNQSAMAGSPSAATVAASFVRFTGALDESCISTSTFGRLALNSRTPAPVARL